MCEAGQRIAVLITLLDVDAGAVGESSFLARDQVTPADSLAVVRPLVFQRIVQVEIGPVRIEEAGADLSAGPEVAIGSLPVNPEAFRQAVGAARADATVVFTAAACRDCVLEEAIGAPDGAGFESHLRDRVRAIALYLGQGNNR